MLAFLGRGLLAGAWLLLAPAGATESVPEATVERLHEALLAIMRDGEALGFEGRHARIAPVIEETFDLAYMSRVVVSRYWPGLTGEQRQRMTEVMSALTVATYAARFDGYSGELFVTTEERALKRARRLVRTELLRVDGEPVRLDYVLHDRDGEWQIVNVVADGVSELALRRTEYASVLDDEGFDALLALLDRQVEDYANGRID